MNWLCIAHLTSDWPSSFSVSGRFWSTQCSDRLRAMPIPLLTIWPIRVPMAVVMPPLTAARVSSTPPITAPITASLAPATDWYTMPTVSDTTCGRASRLGVTLGEPFMDFPHSSDTPPSVLSDLYPRRGCSLPSGNSNWYKYSVAMVTQRKCEDATLFQPLKENVLLRRWMGGQC